jgi:hypothetical protein
MYALASHAQNRNEQLSSTISDGAAVHDLSSLPFENPKMREYFAAVYQQEVDSPVFERIIAAMKNKELQPTGITPQQREALKKERPPIVRYLRSKEGILLPTPQEIQTKLDELDALNKKAYEEISARDDFKKVAEEANREREKLGNTVVKPPRLPSCAKDATEIVRLEDGKQVNAVKNESVMNDVLFIKGEVPLDPDLAFGIGTTVIQYTQDEGDYISYVASLEGVVCLPYRVRMTENHVITDTGINALKNYDRDPRGEIYEGIKQRLPSYR